MSQTVTSRCPSSAARITFRLFDATAPTLSVSRRRLAKCSKSSAVYTEYVPAAALTQLQAENEALTKANAMAAEGRRQFRQSYRDIRDEMKALKYRADKMGLALMMIREGCAEPAKFAGEQLATLQDQQP